MLQLASASALLVVISVASYQVSADDPQPSFPKPARTSHLSYPKYVKPGNSNDVETVYKEFEYDVQEAIWDAVDAARLNQEGDHEHIDYSEFSTFITNFYNKRMNPDNAATNEHLTDAHKRALFRIYDKDHNNHLSMNEAIVGLLLHQEYFFHDIDYNGKLSKSELVAMHDSPHKVASTGKYALSGNIDFLELFQRMLSHSKLKLKWEETLGAVPAAAQPK